MTEQVERVAMAMAYSIRQPNDVSQSAAEYWAHTGSAGQHTWLTAARAAIAAMQPDDAAQIRQCKRMIDAGANSDDLKHLEFEQPHIDAAFAELGAEE